MTRDPALQELLDKQAIAEVIARYSRTLDWLDDDGQASCYWPDAAIDYAFFKGSAADASGLAQVEFALNEDGFQPASGTTNWNAPVSLRVGTNQFRVRSIDKAGNVSALASRSVFYSVTSPLSLGIAGLGRVTGATNGQMLEIGRAYKLTATPGVGQILGEWSRISRPESMCQRRWLARSIRITTGRNSAAVPLKKP